MSHVPQPNPADAAGTPALTSHDGAIAPSSSWLLLRVWLTLGVQSFGGGMATLYLIRQAVVEQQRWLSDEEFARNWAISQIAPGINLLALTILIGKRTGGARGIALSLLGLLLPSTAITVGLTAIYAEIQSLEVVQAGLRGVIPATVALGLLLSWQMSRPLLAESLREGRASLALSCGIILGSGLLVALAHPPVFAVLLAAGAIGAIAGMVIHRRN